MNKTQADMSPKINLRDQMYEIPEETSMDKSGMAVSTALLSRSQVTAFSPCSLPQRLPLAEKTTSEGYKMVLAEVEALPQSY